MIGLSHVPRPRGVVIDIAFPRWLVLLMRVAVSLPIIGILGLIVLGLVVSASPESSVWQGPALAMTDGAFTARPITYQLRVTAGSDTAKDLDKEWTLLMSSGAVHWANVVEGPAKLASGETGSLTLTFLFEPTPAEGEPVALRWDPGRQVGASLELARKP